MAPAIKQALLTVICRRSLYSSALMMLVLAGCIIGVASPARAFTASDASDIWADFNNTFYVGNNGNAYYVNIYGGSKLTFWQQAETIEMACDRETRSGSSGDKAIITALCNGFVADFGTDWTAATSFNDDVMWACLAFARAYYRTGEQSFAGLAADNFNYVYNGGGHRSVPQYDGALGGGMWWTTDHSSSGSKNACVNGPGALAGYWLYQIFGSSTGFLKQSQNMYNWEKSHLYNSSTGQIYDHENANGTLNKAALTYNQGTFLGAAHFLGDDTTASAAALYVKNNMCTEGILPQYNTSGGDSGGFNGIFVRWLGRYMDDTGTQGTYETWLYNNANHALAYENGNGISWCDWLDQTPASGNYSWSCSDSVIIMQVLPPQ